MTEAFNKLIIDKQDRLKEAADKIAEAIEDAYSSGNDTTVVYPDSVFAQKVVDWLIDESLLQIPSELHSDEHFIEHRFNGKVSRNLVNCWGSALFHSPVDPSLYELHLFMSDYEARDEFEELTTDDYRRCSKQLTRFFELAASGELIKVMDYHHPAYNVVHRIQRLYESKQLCAVRFWVLTNRVYAGISSNGRQTQDNIEYSAQIVDLNYISSFFESAVEINQQFHSVGGLAGIEFKANEEQDYDCFLSSITGTTLAQLYSIHGPAIVRANVRAYLGEVTVNKGIQNTVANEPSRFLAYNNGLVISADSVDFHDGKLWDLRGIQIINGGQTTACIYQSWLKAKNNKKDPGAGRRIEENLRKIRIPMKVVVTRESASEIERAEFRVRISEAANSQNIVKHSDLMANSPFQIDFATKVNSLRTPNSNYWFYEAARGLYKAELEKIKGDKIRTKKFNDEHPKHQRFDKTDFALAFMACEGKAQICAKGKELAFNEFHDEISKRWDYENGFTMTDDDAKRLVARWILFSSLEKAVKADKALNIKNPRIPVLYALAMLHEKYGDRIQWDRIWNRQELSPMFLMVLKDTCAKINNIIRSNMGNFMINMFGRQARCSEVVRQTFRFDPTKMNGIYELD